MNRKNFLGIIPAALLLNPLKLKADAVTATAEMRRPAIQPPYLTAGDTIGITCPAGYISSEDIAPAVALMEQWGFKVLVGKTVGARDFTFGGTDEERRQDMQEMIDNPDVKAIMCARGGYGAVRIVDLLNYKKYKSMPKWLIGFSDITIFHCHINRNFRVATLHSKMCNSFPSDWKQADEVQAATILSIKKALTGEKMYYEAAFNSSNRIGLARAELIGGNLRCIENMAGSISEIDTDGKILFVEDTGEAMYSIDRMFYNLKRSGKLRKLKGLIIGGFKLKAEDDNDAFGRSLSDIVLEKVAEYDYPVCFDFPVGHQKANYALKCGVIHEMSVSTRGTVLAEV